MMNFRAMPRVDGVAMSSTRMATIVAMPRNARVLRGKVYCSVFSAGPKMSVRNNPGGSADGKGGVRVTVGKLRRNAGCCMATCTQAISNCFCDGPASFRAMRARIPALTMPIVGGVNRAMTAMGIRIAASKNESVRRVNFY